MPPSTAKLICGRYELPLDKPLIMGIVNLTTDSFSGDGWSNDLARAVDYAHAQIDAGADILDLGAESSRPGATSLSAADEIARLLPVLKELIDCGRPISVDTAKPEVMAAVLAAGADMINDIYALRRHGALQTVAGSRCALCMMHMQGNPATMQNDPSYRNVVEEVASFFTQCLERTAAHAIDRQRIVFDPGFGFGKTFAHNLQMFRSLDRLAEPFDDGVKWPLLVGVSRKSMLGELTGRSVDNRLAASIAAAIAAVSRGAAIVRVHDVAETRDALTVWQALHSTQKQDTQ